MFKYKVSDWTEIQKKLKQEDLNKTFYTPGSNLVLKLLVHVYESNILNILFCLQSKYFHIAEDQVSITYFYAGSKKVLPEVSVG